MSRTQKRVIRNINSFLNSNQKSPNGQSSFSVPEKENQIQSTKTIKEIKEIKEINNISNIRKHKNEINKQAAGDSSSNEKKAKVKRHSSEKARQKRIERRIAKGKPFKRGPHFTQPKDCLERLTENIEFEEIIKNGKPEYILKGILFIYKFM